MTKEEIKALTEFQVEARAAALTEVAKADNPDLEAIEAETLALEERRAQLIEQRKADAAAVAAGAGEVIEKREEKKRMKTIEEIRASREYEEAYANYIKTGSDREIRTLVTDVQGQGGENKVPVPTYLENKIEASWNESRLWSAVRRKVNVKGIMRVPVEYDATPATVHNEAGARPEEESITFKAVYIQPKMIKKWIQITDEVLSLSGREFLDYIYDEIEYQIVQVAENNIVDCILSSSVALPGETPLSRSVNLEKITPATIFAALSVLADGARRPVAIMSKSMFYDFMNLTDLQQRPIYNIVSENGAPAYYINGVEVIFADVNVFGDNQGLIVGDLDGVLVNLPNGDAVDVVYDPYTKAPEDLVTITGKMLMGAEVVKKDYFAVVTFTAGDDDGN